RLSAAQTPRGPAFEAKAWLVGRVAHAEAACKLTADRAARAKSDPWPEFADSNCYACHHELDKKSQARRQNPGHYAGRLPGAAPWQFVWPLTPPGEFRKLAETSSFKDEAATAADKLAAMLAEVQAH